MTILLCSITICTFLNTITYLQILVMNLSILIHTNIVTIRQLHYNILWFSYNIAQTENESQEGHSPHDWLQTQQTCQLWKTKIRTLTSKNLYLVKKSYFLKLISQNAFWTFILNYMYFSYGKWMQEGLPNLTGSCHLAREWKIIQVLHNKQNSINLTFSGNRYIQTTDT